MEAELTEYLAQQGVENLLKDIVVKLCLNKPTDVLEFIKDYVTEMQNERRAEADEEDEDEAPMPRRSSRRGAVSAAVMDADEAESYEKKVVPKDDATMERLKSVVIDNVLFQHLERDELRDVLDAMFEVSPKAGDIIIQQGDEGDNFYVVDTGSTEVCVPFSRIYSNIR